MGFLLIIVFLVTSSWIFVALFWRLQRQKVSIGWWVAFGILVACGTAIGIWCAFYCEYHVGKSYRIASFPIPVVFFHLEDGVWVDFPVPKFQAWSAAFTNIITLIALSTLPLWLASWRRREGKKESPLLVPPSS